MVAEGGARPRAIPGGGRAYRRAEFEADAAIHVIGVPLGAIAGIAVAAITPAAADRRLFSAVAAYAAGLILMLGCSAAYNLRRESRRRELLRRFDHAAIFVMIAGTYTPFTACVLHGPLAVWSTLGIWAAAIAGAALKLSRPHGLERVSVALYLALGWAVLVIVQPMLAAVDRPTAILLVTGGVVYSVGAGIHLWRRLPFHDAIWHALVLVAAGCHYAAIVNGVILSAPPI